MKGSPASRCLTCGDHLRDCTCDHSFDCPICETMVDEWNDEGCSCWFCPSCKVTNPETVTQCECGKEKVA